VAFPSPKRNPFAQGKTYESHTGLKLSTEHQKAETKALARRYQRLKIRVRKLRICFTTISIFNPPKYQTPKPLKKG